MPAPGSDRRPVAMMGVWELEMPAVPASLDEVQDLVARLYGETADTLSATDRIRFETALVEVVGNVIEHGRATGDHVSMRVTLARTGTDLVATVSDDAAPATVDLDAAVMSDPDDESGRGLAMARALATELRHVARASGNEWTVRCRCAG